MCNQNSAGRIAASHSPATWRIEQRHRRTFARIASTVCSGSFLTVVLGTSALGREDANCEARAAVLLSRMTLEEKIGQMTQVDMNAMKDKADITKYFIGSMLSGGDSDPADITPEGWRLSVREIAVWIVSQKLDRRAPEMRITSS